MAIAVEVALRPDGELAAALARLVPQLSSSSAVPDQDQLRRIVEFPGNRLLVARDRGGIVGMLTLVMFPIPTGLRARIEDVVVDQAARGRGVGEALIREALRLAAASGARSVDLTSRPSREDAIRLYRRLGFEERASRVFRHNGPA
jgi:ribosomal protein S18 acetylase RimI-like enzyme